MLLRKLIRTMGRYRAQFISMVIMIALGVGTFVGFNVEWFSLERDVTEFLDDTGFADYRIIRETGFSEEDAAEIGAVDGVDAVSRVLTLKTLVSGTSDVLSLCVTENEKVSGVLVTSGESYDRDDGDGFWVSDRYAEANGVKIGDRVSLTYKDLTIEGTVRGLVKSGEYLICIPDETQLMPDYDTYGFAYASPAMVRRVLGAEFYTSLNVLSDLPKDEFTEKADRALGETLLIVSRDDTVSYSEAMGESKEGKTMALILPVLFLAIAVLTMVTTMHRLTASEKTQIGTLKSLGFTDRRILRHYSFYAGAVGLLGIVLGVGLGWWLGWFIMNPGGSMGTYLDMPSWKLSAPLYVWITLIVMELFLLLIGFLSVKSMLRGTAADALRPYTPKKVRSIILERTALWDKLGFGTKWNLRDVLRHKARSFMTLFGVIGCMVLIVAAMGMEDTMDEFMDSFYGEAINYETKINLDSETTDREGAREIAALYSGDTCASLSVQTGGRSVMLEIYNMTHDTVRFLDRKGNRVPIPDDGVLICERIARDDSLGEGDEMIFSPFGSDKEYRVRIRGVVRSLTESVIMSEEYADGIGLPFAVNAVYTGERDIARDSRILNTQSKQNVVDSFDTFMEIMTLMIWLLIAAAAILGVVVLYNLGVMSYTERYREMATLKVIGFRDGKIGRLLVGQNMMLTVLGIVIGIPAGIGVLKYLLVALASEYELKLALTWRTFAVSVALILGVSLLVSLMIARKNKKIDMVEALKGRD